MLWATQMCWGTIIQLDLNLKEKKKKMLEEKTLTLKGN